MFKNITLFYLIINCLIISEVDGLCNEPIDVRSSSTELSNTLSWSFSSGKRKNNDPYYLSTGFGTAVWSQLRQPPFEMYKRPLNIIVEYRRGKKPVSLAAEAIFLGSYEIDDFLLKPNYFCIYPKAYLSGLSDLPKWFDAYAFAGIQLSYTVFTEKAYPGIVDYEYEIERDLSPAYTAGTGLSFYYRNFEISPRISYHSGKGEYYAGYFTRQQFNTSTINAMVYFSYKFPILKQRGIICPAYR